MSLIRTTATIGPDGRLHLDLPVGPENAGREVEVTVEPVPSASRQKQSHEEYLATLDALYGSSDDPTFDPRGSRSRGSAITYPPDYRRMTPEEWKRFIEETAGSIDDPTFVRPVTGPPQDRRSMFD